MRSPTLLYVLFWILIMGGSLLVFWKLVRQLQLTLKQMSLLMEEQVSALRGASSAQNLMSLIEFVQDSKTREARRVVLEGLTGKKESECNPEQRAAAFLVCSTYDVAGILIRNKLAPAPPFVTNWGTSIVKCHKSLEGFMDSVGAERWDDFGWLRKEVEFSQSPSVV